VQGDEDEEDEEVPNGVPLKVRSCASCITMCEEGNHSFCLRGNGALC
jgi:hypothetical protein